jgi:tetratricopeptide (TPR) repeat protein
MKVLIAALIATSAMSGVACAADQPVFGPVPSWVKPVVQPAVPAKTDEAPIRILLSDQQVALDPQQQTVYTDIALRFQTPQGLAAGNVSLSWRPETDVLTVHKLVIRRGDQTIDVLASGQTFTVLRREQNLESSTLDGILTANLQPEGLQVGDTLEFAMSVSRSDPTLNGHVEQLAGAWNGVAIDKAHLRIQWPSNLPVRFRQTASLPALKPMPLGSFSTVEVSLDNVEPVILPRGAPARYGIGRLVEVTDFASWADLASLWAPLYNEAAVIPEKGALRTELERIQSLSPDPKVRAEAALTVVQDRVRYVALAMGTGAYVPTNAETTWSRRYGDCKGKTALLLALLHAMNIPAEPVVVSTIFGDGLDARLPLLGLFNHVLVRAVVAGRTYWMDGTRTGDTSLDRLTVPNLGWGLPLVSEGAALVRMLPEPLDEPTHDTSIRIDATAGISVPAPTNVETILRGDGAIQTNAVLANLVGDARNRALKEYWKKQYDFIEVKTASASFDPKSGEQHLAMEGVAKMDWQSGAYETDGTSVGYHADFSRDAGSDKDAPFAVPFPSFTRTTETILLPKGHGDFTFGSGIDVEQTNAGIQYRRHASIKDDVFTIEKTERSVAPEFAAKEAPAAQAALRLLRDYSAKLDKPVGYKASDEEIAAARAQSPTTASEYANRAELFMDRDMQKEALDDYSNAIKLDSTDSSTYVSRGNLLLNAKRYDEAIQDFDHAVSLAPKDAMAFADRGMTHAWKGELEKASQDVDTAHAIDPKNVVVFRARGFIAQRRGEWREAVSAYTTALLIEPNNSFALGRRAESSRALGDNDAALQDAAAALTLDPEWIELYRLRASILWSQGKQGEALSEAAAVVAASPKDSAAYVVAADIYSALHRNPEAMQAYGRAIALEPNAALYLDRSHSRPKTDLAGRGADLDAALKLDPKFADAIVEKANLMADGGDLTGAISSYSSALKRSPEDVTLLTGRGIIYTRSGDLGHAEDDFKQATALASKPAIFNHMCWAKATAGVALESALADCDAALAKAPDLAAYLDSRGLVLLRLGRLDEAIADYDHALTKNPNSPSSLFGRSIARARKGDREKSEADAATASKIYPEIREEYERYGLKL